MSNYQVKETSRTTTNNYALAGLLAGHILAVQAAQAPEEYRHEVLLATPYRTNAVLSSFDQCRTVFGRVLERGPDRFVEGISNFYSRLADSQEPLAPEFSRVLHANLWDLYER